MRARGLGRHGGAPAAGAPARTCLWGQSPTRPPQGAQAPNSVSKFLRGMALSSSSSICAILAVRRGGARVEGQWTAFHACAVRKAGASRDVAGAAAPGIVVVVEWCAALLAVVARVLCALLPLPGRAAPKRALWVGHPLERCCEERDRTAPRVRTGDCRLTSAVQSRRDSCVARGRSSTAFENTAKNTKNGVREKFRSTVPNALFRPGRLTDIRLAHARQSLQVAGTCRTRVRSPAACVTGVQVTSCRFAAI